MKSGKSLFFLLTVGALVITSPSDSVAREHPAANPIFATSAVDGARLILKFSPVLGFNVGISARIDGREAGALTKGHIYERHLTAGPHFVQVIPNGRRRDACEMMLDVRRGQTYAYVIKYSDQIVLEPTSWIL